LYFQLPFSRLSTVNRHDMISISDIVIIDGPTFKRSSSGLRATNIRGASSYHPESEERETFRGGPLDPSTYLVASVTFVLSVICQTMCSDAHLHRVMP
jgi:hypothetical protein